MPYGHYSGPNKPDKGQENGSCNRTSCQDAPAHWYNHGSLAWYCGQCRAEIQFDSFNLRNWNNNHKPDCGHPMFETREMMDQREADQAAKDAQKPCPQCKAPRLFGCTDPACPTPKEPPKDFKTCADKNTQ